MGFEISGKKNDFLSLLSAFLDVVDGYSSIRIYVDSSPIIKKKRRRYVDSSGASMPLYMNWLGNI